MQRKNKDFGEPKSLLIRGNMDYKRIAIITAAGKGIRLNKKIKKQYLKLKDKPLIYYTIKTFNELDSIDEIIIVSDEDGLNYVKKNIVEKYSFNKVSNIVLGGKTRSESVYNGFKVIDKKNSIILIHDGVRPFIDKEIIEKTIRKAEDKGAAVVGIKATDTMKILKNQKILRTLDRRNLFQVQTPQVFKYEVLNDSYNKINLNDEKITDEAYIVEKSGHEIYIIYGSKKNIKITTTFDLKFAEYLIDLEK